MLPPPNLNLIDSGGEESHAPCVHGLFTVLLFVRSRTPMFHKLKLLSFVLILASRLYHATVVSSGRIWNISRRRCIIQPWGMGKTLPPAGFPDRFVSVCVGMPGKVLLYSKSTVFESHRPRCAVPHRQRISRRRRRISSFPPFDESRAVKEHAQGARKKGDRVN